MSNVDVLLKKAVDASLQQTAASKSMSDKVRSMMANIDQRVNEAESELNLFMATARGEMSHILMSRNQIMVADGNTAIKGFSTLYLDSFEVVTEATIRGSYGSDIDHTGNGYAEEFRKNVYGGYVNQPFNILRLKWTRSANTHPARLDNNFNQGYQQGAITTGCYLKVLRGDIQGQMTSKIDYGNDWHFYGYRNRVDSLDDAFRVGHTNIGLSSSPGDSGEMLICLYGSVSGYVPFENNIWGVFPEFARPSDI